MSQLTMETIRAEFPILKTKVKERDLVYFDNGATTQKPLCVINAISDYYASTNSNVHRGVHYLCGKATNAYEDARKTVQKFINAESTDEIVFVRGCTEAINLVASCFGRAFIKSGDEIIVSQMEHHSNIVPWQLLCEQTGAKLKVVPVLDNGELDYTAYEKLFTERTKFVSIVHVSNSIGTVNDVKRIVDLAHKNNCPVLIDGAQAVPHMPVDVQALGCDFYAFSGHKMYGPTGIGVLYGKKKWLEQMPPYQGGGEMIAQVSFDEVSYNVLPYKFEAGTPNIVGAIGLAKAIEYIQSFGYEFLMRHEQELMQYATQKLLEIPGLSIIGTAKHKSAAISFVIDNIHPHDIGTILDFEGVAIRAGHHCTMPLMQRFDLPATARASFAVYNTKDEVDLLIAALHKVQEILK